jgi:chitinase
LKLVLSLGGGGEKDAKYSHMISSPETRKTFIHNTIAYLHKYGFDGLDLDWEYPVCWGGNCNKGPKSDFENFAHLLKELRDEFDKQNPRLLLSAAVVGGGEIADKSYDMKALGTYLDYINVMTYDAAGSWDHKTGHHSGYQMCIDVMNYFHNKGIAKEKLLMGVPFYGVTFTLKDNNQHKIGAPTTGDGHFPSNEGNNAFYWEVCDMVKHQGWHKELAHNGHDPIAYHNNQWVGYDDPNQAFQKSKWVKDNGYGGVIIWEITQDDWHKRCCGVNYPMLRAINHGLFGTGQDPSTYGCE